MTAVVLAAALAVLVVLLWPGRRPSDEADAALAAGRRDSSRPALEGGADRFRRALSRLRGGGPAGSARAGPDEAWVADLAEVVAVGLRAGLDLASAVRVAAGAPSVAVAAPWLGPALEDPERRVAVSAVVAERPADATGGAALDVLARAWRLSERTGASAAHTTAAAAEAVRGRSEARHRLEAALAGPRASMRLLTLLPLLGPGAALLLGLDPARVYGPPAARVAVGAGLVLTALGWWWSRRLVGRACRPGTTGG